MASGDSADAADGYDGSSTESEYYEDAEYETLECCSSADADAGVQTHEVVDLCASDTPDSPASDAPAESDGAHTADAPSWSPSEPIVFAHPASLYDDDSQDSDAGTRDVDGYQEAVATLKPDIILPEQPTESPATDKDNSAACDHCRAFVTVELPHSTAFQRANRLCHCCKVSMGTVNRSILHKDYELVRLRFCGPCFEVNGRKFMTKVRIMKMPRFVKCSGCQEVQFMKYFHKRQQIYRPWEEQPGQRHLCLKCLPSGFEADEDRIVPIMIKCVKCDLKKNRVAFIRSLQEHSIGFDAMKQLQLWVKDAFCVCNDCMIQADNDSMLLNCYRCNRQLPRSKFPLKQQRFAQFEDENPGRSERKPVYSCIGCKSAFPIVCPSKSTTSTHKRRRDGNLLQNHRSRQAKESEAILPIPPTSARKTRVYVGQVEFSGQ